LIGEDLQAARKNQEMPMDAHEMLDTADERIRDRRTAEVELSLVDDTGRALPHLACNVGLTRHEFRIGANAYRLFGLDDPELEEAYQERFADLLNYATLPFYWGGYEPEKDVNSRERLESMADWCRGKGLTTKGHPLVWHEVFPEWANEMEDEEALERQQARVREIVSHFRGRIDTWDVVNEATVSHRFDNAIGRWIAREGSANCVVRSLQWAHEASPDATLLYNDFNVSEDFENLVGALIKQGAPVHVIGIQSHMHRGHWPIERVWQVCEDYARFGLPLHFTETTALSGRLKGENDNEWHARHTDWKTTAEGEARQFEYGQQFYTTLFSHPAVEAITWWDFSDNGSWQGAPAGLVREDMSQKPFYDWLLDAFHQRWTTRADITADENGAAKLRCYFGDYAVRAKLPSGDQVSGTFTLPKRGDRRARVVLR